MKEKKIYKTVINIYLQLIDVYSEKKMIVCYLQEFQGQKESFICIWKKSFIHR